jgi:glycosyltransferase involved in cell wall biosynthesis
MRIVIDLQGAQTASRFRGIGRYSSALTRGILRNAGRHDVWLVLNGALEESIAAIRAEFGGLVSQERIRVFQVPGHVAEMDTRNAWRCRAAEVMREQFIAQLEPDVVLVTSLFEGYVDDAVGSVGTFVDGRRTAVILYDLIPLLNPDFYLGSPSQRKAYMRKIESLRRAGLLLSISDYARAEAIGALGLEHDRVVAISTAVDESFQPRAPTPDALAALRAQFGITRSVVMCAPGGYDARKNLACLVTAFSLLPAPLRATHQLLIASKIAPVDRKALVAHAQAHGLSGDDLILTGYVSDDDLIMLYQAATLFVFPSLHEGFGMPVLEAMACGTPAIGSNTTSIPEVVGLDDAMFDPTRPQSIADKIAEVLSDPELYERLRAHGRQQAARFSWDNTAKRALHVLEAHAAATSAPPPRTRPDLLRALTAVPGLPANEAALLELAVCLAAFPNPRAPRQCLIDIELMACETASWHNVAAALLRDPPAGTNVELVRLSQREDTWHYRYAGNDARVSLGLPATGAGDRVADLRTGDLLLCTSAAGTAEAARSGLFEHLRRIGVELHVVLMPAMTMLDELASHASQIIHGPSDGAALPDAEVRALLALPRPSCWS